jgi:hypothetical protein
MTYLTSAKVMKSIAGLAGVATFLSACNSGGTPEIAAVPEPAVPVPVVPTLPAVEEPISFDNTTATAPSTVRFLQTSGFFDGTIGNSNFTGNLGTYNHLTRQVTADGNIFDVGGQDGYKYLAG